MRIVATAKNTHKHNGWLAGVEGTISTLYYRHALSCRSRGDDPQGRSRESRMPCPPTETASEKGMHALPSGA